MQSIIQALLSVNESLFLAINGPAGHTPLPDKLMPLFANDLLYLFPLLLLALWWTPSGKTLAARQERSTSREAVLWAVVAVVLALVLNVTFGAAIPEPRPFATQPIHLLITHSKDASFPSDHAAITFAIAGVLGLRFWMALRLRALPPARAQWQRDNRPLLSNSELTRLRLVTCTLALLGLFFALATGYARIYVGVHYPLDILGGALIGLISAVLVFLAHKLLQPVARLLERGAKLVHLA